jgi:ubiquinone/menaquinone biosynthesis C-methylase UbiE
MLTSVLPYMSCQRCAGCSLHELGGRIVCTRCGTVYFVREGILDMLGEANAAAITPFQRIMQTRWVVSIYERAWRRAGYFLASSRSFKYELRTILHHVERKKPQRVLDVACGPGVFTRPMAKIVQGVVVGFDLSWPMLREAQRRISEEGCKNVVLIRGNVLQMPFIASAFPFINCCGALHLFERPDAALREMERVICPGGHLLVQTTIRPARSAGVAFVLEKFIRFGFFEESDLLEKMRLHRFKILDAERHRISYTFLAQHAS